MLQTSFFGLPAVLNFFANLLFGFENRSQMFNFAGLIKENGTNHH